MSRIARADDTVTFPLQGYYHPGRYMPLHVTMSPRSADEENVKLAANEGSIWTYIRFEGGPIDVTVPWMVVDRRARGLNWYVYPRKGGVDVDTPLKPLADNERLAGYAGVDAAAALEIVEQIYPGERVTLVALNPALPLPGSPAAWETLDAVVLNSTAASRIGDQRFAALVAGGTAFAVHADSAAAPWRGWPGWPWKRQGGWHVMHYRPAGPLAATYSEAIYQPVASWSSGWPANVRQGMGLAAVVFSILALLMALWHPRFSVPAVMLISIGFLGLMYFWIDHRKPSNTVGGKVRIISQEVTQDDDWAYQSSHQRTHSNIRWVDTTRVMFSTARQLDQCAARVVCYPNGDPDYLFFDLPAKAKVALLSRRCGPRAPNVTPSTAISSPLADLVKSMYLKPGDQIVGEFPSTPVIGEAYAPVLQWPGLIVKRRGD